MTDSKLTRRGLVAAGLVTTGLAAAGALVLSRRDARVTASFPTITVYKDPDCGCCTAWAAHLRREGFVTELVDTRELDALKRRFGVPDELASCHTAVIGGIVVEGHVPARALKRFLAEKPDAAGLAVPGMPVGSPGMEGGAPEAYEVVLFGGSERRTFMRFVGDRAVG